MGMSYGDVFAQGIIGAIGGMGQASYLSALEEQKRETERLREERLSKLRLGEYAAKSEMDIANIPKKGAAEIDVAVKAEEAKRPGIIDTARQRSDVETTAIQDRARNSKDLEGEYAQQDAERAGLIAGAQANAQLPVRLAEINAGGANAMKVAILNNEEAAKRDWTAGADGKYYDAHGNAVTTRVKIEGRGYEEVPVMAPKNKLESAASNWKEKEELDSINKQIEKARADSNDPMKKKAATESLRKLMAQKQELLGGKGGSAGQFKTPDDYIGSILGR